jgi:hypothetical protein
VHPFGIVGKLTDRFDVSRKPSEAVGGALLAVEQALDRVRLDADTFARRRRVPEYRLGRKPAWRAKATSLSPARDDQSWAALLLSLR